MFSTIEGGAIICHAQEMKHHIDNLKNFGFQGETIVEEPGRFFSSATILLVPDMMSAFRGP